LASATDDWYAKCLTGSRGGVLSNHANVLLALRSDPAWLDVLAYDEMREQVMLLRAAPVHGRPPSPPHKEPRPWTDIEDAAAQEWLQIAGLPGVGRETVATAVSQRSRELSYHPLRDWLNELKWDGIPRVEGGTTPGGEILEPWLSTYFGAPNTTYTQAIGTMWLVSAVARVLEPGCKVDHMLILEGDQGTGKSAACRILCGECYFSDTLPEIGSKDAKAHLSGKWIVELAELDALLRAEPSSTKAFLTQQIDRFRPAYARRDVDSPRQCVFVGTTNQKQYLKDETGGRRFWPVQTGVIDLPSLSTDRVQLWAEAVHLYRRGRKWHITDSDLLKVADAEQSARFDIDAWEEPIAEYLEDKPEVTIGQVMREALYIETPRMERRAQNRVKRILTHLGWRRGSRHKQGQLWMKAGSIG
jgi:predicted P-loop ATPase